MITSHPVIYQLVRPSTSTLLVHGKFQIILKTHFPHAHIAHTAHTPHTRHTPRTHIHTTHKQHTHTHCTHTVRTPYAHHTHTSRNRMRAHTHTMMSRTHRIHALHGRHLRRHASINIGLHTFWKLIRLTMYIISLTTIYDYITTIN